MAHAVETATVSCVFGDHKDKKHFLFEKVFSEKLMMDVNEREKSQVQIPANETLIINGKHYAVYVRYLGKIGNKSLRYIPKDRFRINLFDVEKDVYASSINDINEGLHTSFLYPDESFVSVYCSVEKDE